MAARHQTLAAAAPSGPSGGVFSGSAFGPDTTNALVRVTTNGPLTTSGTSASFAMLTPSLTVTSPAAGAALYTGSRWRSPGKRTARGFGQHRAESRRRKTRKTLLAVAANTAARLDSHRPRLGGRHVRVAATAPSR